VRQAGESDVRKGGKKSIRNTGFRRPDVPERDAGPKLETGEPSGDDTHASAKTRREPVDFFGLQAMSRLVDLDREIFTRLQSDKGERKRT
jgi:hypothetical protein